jgi:hypothetical protein
MNAQETFTIGLDNVFIPRKGRSIDTSKRVRIYRNLSGGEEKKYSIVQGDKVVGYTNQFMLRDCKCYVSKRSVEKVRKMKRKITHAFISGEVSMRGGMGITAANKRGLPAKIVYDPYKYENFMCENLTRKPYKINGARVIVFRPEGVSGAYTF